MDLQRCRSRELRGGILYTSCGCTRRNGLQYDCPRSECQGRRVCLKKPYPKCCASMYGNRFGNISMGKSTDPVGARQIRVFNNGACCIQYDPCVGPKGYKDTNPCGPQIIKCQL